MAPKTAQTSVLDPTELLLGKLYAQALLDSLPEDQDALEIADELEALAGVLEQVREAKDLLAGTMMNAEQRTAVVRRIFAGRVSEKLEAFLMVLDRHGRMGILRTAARSFRKLLNLREGKIDVTLTTVVELDESQKAAVRDELSSMLGGQAVLRTRLDEDLLGGAVLRIGDRVYDASIRSQLARMRERLAAGRGSVRHDADNNQDNG